MYLPSSSSKVVYNHESTQTGWNCVIEGIKLFSNGSKIDTISSYQIAAIILITEILLQRLN